MKDNAAPYGYMLDPTTGELRPKKRAGRPRTYEVADELDEAAHVRGQRSKAKRLRDEFHERNPTYRKDNAAEFRAAHPEKIHEYQQRYRLKLKAEVIDHYGGICACCGEDELIFLTIDHINNDGAEHRRQISQWGGGGGPTYRWLRDNDYPDGFQVLCANCNCGRQWNGGTCPHQLAASALLGVACAS